METATKIKDLEGFTGRAALYELSKPIEYDKPWSDREPPAKQTTFVAVSATNIPFSGPETYIFAANEDGGVIDWCELSGSYRGGLSHAKALNRAGYIVKDI